MIGQGQFRLQPEVWQADCELHQWICRELNGGSLSGGGAGSPVDSFELAVVPVYTCLSDTSDTVVMSSVGEK